MQRSYQIPERDRKIGDRLRELRHMHLAKRTALAVKLGISNDRLASYEFGRAALPWAIGLKICEILNVSQVYLATGVGDWGHYSTLRLSSEPPPRMRFSEGYDQYFLPALAAVKKEVIREIPGRDAESVKLRKAIARFGRPSGLQFTPAEFPRLTASFAQIIEIMDAAKRRKEVVEKK